MARDCQVDLPRKLMRHISRIDIEEGELGPISRSKSTNTVCIRVHFKETLDLPPIAVLETNVDAAKTRLIAILQTYLFDVLHGDRK